MEGLVTNAESRLAGSVPVWIGVGAAIKIAEAGVTCRRSVVGRFPPVECRPSSPSNRVGKMPTTLSILASVDVLRGELALFECSCWAKLLRAHCVFRPRNYMVVKNKKIK